MDVTKERATGGTYINDNGASAANRDQIHVSRFVRFGSTIIISCRRSLSLVNKWWSLQ